MAYYFMVENKKGNYQPINISNSIYFESSRTFKKTCAYSLPEIDRFTMMFDDELELRERLVQEGILPFEYFEKPLSIRFSNQGEYNKVPYDLLHQKDIEFVMEPNRLINKIMNRFYEGDLSLIKKITNFYSEFRRCSSTAPEIRQYIDISIREGKTDSRLTSLDENKDKLITRLLKLIIFESYDTQSGRVVYKDTINYRNLHTLIALVNYHDEQNKKSIQSVEQNNTKEEPTTAEPSKVIIPEEKPKQVKTRILSNKNLGRKKYSLDDQLEFDI